MTIRRSAGLQRLIDAMRDAIAARESFPGSAKALADRSFEALQQVAPESAEVRASRLPACDLLAEALAAVAWASGMLSRMSPRLLGDRGDPALEAPRQCGNVGTALCR